VGDAADEFADGAEAAALGDFGVDPFSFRDVFDEET